MRPQLLDMAPEALEALVQGMGERPFRARQIREALLKGLPLSEMTVLSKDLRARLEAQADTGVPEIIKALASGDGETVKFLFRLSDGQMVESVLMAYRHGNTLCVSTQVGCRMGCAFCASTVGGRARDLTSGEMLGEVVAASAWLRKEKGLTAGERAVGNVVLMGSGEPLDNYDNVLAFLRTLSDPDWGLGMSLRHVSVSTCGLPQRMRALTDTGLPVTLCVSLHAPNDAVRKRIMPVAARWPIDEVMDAARYYVQKTGRRVIFEYILIRGLNDGLSHARELAARLKGLQCHVNLIVYNAVDHAEFKASVPRDVERFENELKRLKISCTRRRVLGADIEGACGQLRKRALETMGEET
jgi:23S rRNA (adenine2503-C2)-methyltransferase